MQVLPENTTENTSSWVDIKLCHIDDGSGERAFCDSPDANGPITCSDYDGESICPTCGNPMCPYCVKMEDIEYRLGNQNA